jgi:hypothetical protein
MNSSKFRSQVTCEGLKGQRHLKQKDKDKVKKS